MPAGDATVGPAKVGAVVSRVPDERASGTEDDRMNVGHIGGSEPRTSGIDQRPAARAVRKRQSTARTTGRSPLDADQPRQMRQDADDVGSAEIVRDTTGGRTSKRNHPAPGL